MQNEGVLQQQIQATTTSLWAFLKESIFFLSRAPVLQRGLKLSTQTFWSSSCALNLAALFSPQLCVTLSWSLPLGKKSFMKSPGEQNTLSLGKAGGYTRICVHPRPLPAHQPSLHHKAEDFSPAPMSWRVSILFPGLTLMEVTFCCTCSRLNPNHSQDDKSCDRLLFTLHRFHSELSRH